MFALIAEFEKLELEHREMKIQYFQLKEKYDDLTEKMRFFTKVLAPHANSHMVIVLLLWLSLLFMSFNTCKCIVSI